VDVVANKRVHLKLTVSDGVDLMVAEERHDVMVGDVDAELVASASARGVAAQAAGEPRSGGVPAGDAHVYELSGVVKDGVDPGARSTNDLAVVGMRREPVRRPGLKRT
jgi:hypothetical protein